MESSKAGVIAGTIVVLVVLVLLPITHAGTTITGDRAQVGRNYDARVEVSDTRYRSSLQLPQGRLDVGVDAPLPAWPVDDPQSSGEKKTLLAPRNGSFVLVAWGLHSSPGDDLVLDGEYGLPRRPDEFDSIMLVAGGIRYLLSAGDDTFGSTVWSVPGNGEDARVEVTVDGVTQSVLARTGARSVGRAAALYGQPAARSGDCGTPRYAAPFSSPPVDKSTPANTTCDYQVRRVGYVAGKGYAPAGDVWLVVELDLAQPDEVMLIRAGRRDAYSFGFGDEVTATLDGQAGAPAVGSFRDRDGFALYFAVPRKTTLPASLAVTRTQSVHLTVDDRKPDRVRVPLVQTFTVPLR